MFRKKVKGGEGTEKEGGRRVEGFKTGWEASRRRKGSGGGGGGERMEGG